MKMKNMKNKTKYFGALLALSLLLPACNRTDFDAVDSSKLMGDSLTTTYSIKQLIDSFKSTYDAYTDTAGYTADLFTTKLITTKDNSEVVISGVVTSSDVEGNVYKYITVQELGAGGRAIKVSVDASGLSALYPLGQRVWINCKGLYMGNYAQCPLIGSRYINTEKSKYKISIDSTIYRVEPGRIPAIIAYQHIHAYGMPDTTLVKADTMTIAQIKAAGASMYNKLVCIKNAFFTGKGADYGQPAMIVKAEDYIFAPSTNGVGFPQSREIQDGTGSMFVSTSEYAKFATIKLPSSTYRGNITALVAWYNDKDKSASSTKIYHQLTLRGLKDLGKGFEGFHLEVKK